MVYKKHFVAAIKVAGNTLNEKEDNVYLPYQSEYSIFMKNHHDKRCLVTIEIDGNNISGNGIVINPNDSINLERFIDSKRKFKFIERTKAIENHRGINAEDSLIIIHFDYEVTNTTYIKTIRGITQTWDEPPIYNPRTKPYYILQAINSSNTIHSYSCNSTNDTGITVEGSKSNQRFNTVNSFNTELNPTKIIFKLNADDKPITKKSKKSCSSCGKKWKAKHKYCPNDGTYLK